MIECLDPLRFVITEKKMIKRCTCVRKKRSCFINENFITIPDNRENLKRIVFEIANYEMNSFSITISVRKNIFKSSKRRIHFYAILNPFSDTKIILFIFFCRILFENFFLINLKEIIHEANPRI